ncbi:MAG: hypothetical protein MJE66_15340 [Proteobacteria bacterium]|nr:hypothetical protein [Pseudomonadota bacterium]
MTLAAAVVWAGSLPLVAAFALWRRKRERDLALVYAVLRSVSPECVSHRWIHEHTSFTWGADVQAVLDELVLRGLVVIRVGDPCGYRVADGDGHDDESGGS